MSANSGAADCPPDPSELRFGLSSMMPITNRGLSAGAMPANVML